MKLHRSLVALALIALLPIADAAQKAERTPGQLFAAAVFQLVLVVEPTAEAPPRTLAAELVVRKADGLPEELLGRRVKLAYQAPDRLRLEVEIGGDAYLLGRDGGEIWMHAPAADFALRGRPGVARFATNPDELDTLELGAFALPFGRESLALLPFLFDVEARAG